MGSGRLLGSCGPPPGTACLLRRRSAPGRVTASGAPPGSDEAALIAAAGAGDPSAFASLTQRYRRELQAHCYRMVGSLQDSEDLVQETFLRAWRSRSQFSYQGGSSYRAWLYRVATNACFDLLRSKPRTPFPWQPHQRGASGSLFAPDPDLDWLQPYPDQLLEVVAPQGEQPDVEVVARETIELAFIVVIQLLPARQRAALILRDVLGWSAKETAALLDMTVAAANSALQRARATLRKHLPKHRVDWAAPSQPTEDERALLKRYTDAHERRDFTGIAKLLRDDARLTMPPTPSWFAGSEAIAGLFESWLDARSPSYVGDVRRVAISANRQPGFAGYLRRPDDSAYRPLGLEFLRFESGLVAELTMFVDPDLFPKFALPETL
jgi:RNA polymerase sigma-70 factor, ECF subfamily